RTADGNMQTYVVHPEEGGPHPAVFFYMDAPGKRPELHDMACRLATAGYYVALPNLYYRGEAHFELDRDDPASTARMRELMAQLDDDLVVRDTEALVDLVDGDPAADASRIGCVGYCMSGPFVVAVAGSYPDRVRAGASFHGV